MKLNLLTIVALTLLSYSLNAREIDRESVTEGSTGPDVMLSGIRDRAEDLPEPRLKANEEEPTQVVPSEDTSPHSSTEDDSQPRTGEGDSPPVQEEGLKWYHPSQYWTGVKGWTSKTVRKGYAYKEKVLYSREYGDLNGEVDNLVMIKQTESAIQQADEVRDQRALMEQVRLDKREILNDKTLLCLTLNGYYEARNQAAIGEIGTAADVMNRLSVGYRDATTVCGVITSPAQFSWYGEFGMQIPDFDNDQEEKAWERSILIAKRMMDPDAVYIDPTNGATMYHNPSISKPKWRKDYRDTANLGDHLFQGEKDPNHKYYIDVSKPRLNPILFNGLSHAERNSMKKAFQSKKRT